MKAEVLTSQEKSKQPDSVAVTQSNYQKIQSWFKKGSTRDAFMQVCGETYGPRFMQSVLAVMSIGQGVSLRKCDPLSVVRSAMVSAYTGLTIDPNLGQSALVPYGDQCTFQIMRRGLQQLTLRTGTVAKLNEAKVYDGDIGSYNPFTGDIQFNFEDHPRDLLVGFVSYIKLLTGFEKFEYWTVEQCQKHGMRYSKSYHNPKGFWRQNFDVMAQKTVTKSLLRNGSILNPYSTEAMTQLAVGLKFDQGTPQSIEITPETAADYPDGQSYEESIINREEVQNAD